MPQWALLYVKLKNKNKMDLKKILIVGAVIGVAYYFYSKKKNARVVAQASLESDTSNINGAQLLYVEKQAGR